MSCPSHLPKEEAHRLMRRYALWCYKTLKEEWDRSQRYWTQLEIDVVVEEHLKAALNTLKTQQDTSEYEKLVAEFSQYIATKRERVHRETYADGSNEAGLVPRLWYVQQRLMGLKKAVIALLGESVWEEIQQAYEEEMQRRILISPPE